MNKFILLFILISLNAYPKALVKPFKITISGDQKDLPSISKMAELEVAKSTIHCRGAYIPYAKSKWNCSGGECTRMFGCRRITKSYSRITLIGATRKSLKKAKKIGSDYEIRWPTQKPPSFDTGKAAKKRKVYKKQMAEIKREKKQEKQLEFVKIKEYKIKKKPMPAPEKDTPKVLEEEALALLEEENLKDYDDVFAQKESKMYQDANLEDISPGGEKAFKAEIKEDDAKWKLVTKTEEDGSEKIYELKKHDKGPPTFKMRMKWANFSLSYVNVSDNTDTRIGTGNASWSPQFIFHPHWSVKLDAGVQFYSIEVVDQGGSIIETTTFPVIPLLISMNYLGQYFFLEAGGGGQFWWEDRLDNFGMWTVGFGFRFPVTTPFFDRIFFNYNNVYTETSIQEFKVGLGVRF